MFINVDVARCYIMERELDHYPRHRVIMVGLLARYPDFREHRHAVMAGKPLPYIDVKDFDITVLARWTPPANEKMPCELCYVKHLSEAVVERGAGNLLLVAGALAEAAIEGETTKCLTNLAVEWQVEEVLKRTGTGHAHE